MGEASWPRLRPATNTDGRAVADMVYAVLAEYDLQPDPGGIDADLQDIEQSYLRRGGVFYVLEAEDGAVIGSYGLYPIADGGLWMADSNCGSRLPSAVLPATHTPSAPGPSAPDATPTTCELRKMYLHRDYRGRGLGRRLLEHALAEARRLGFKRITLETASILETAGRLYQGYGFVPYQPEHLSRRCDQAYVLDLASPPPGGEKPI